MAAFAALIALNYTCLRHVIHERGLADTLLWRGAFCVLTLAVIMGARLIRGSAEPLSRATLRRETARMGFTGLGLGAQITSLAQLSPMWVAALTNLDSALLISLGAARVRRFARFPLAILPALGGLLLGTTSLGKSGTAVLIALAGTSLLLLGQIVLEDTAREAPTWSPLAPGLGLTLLGIALCLGEKSAIELPNILNVGSGILMYVLNLGAAILVKRRGLRAMALSSLAGGLIASAFS